MESALIEDGNCDWFHLFDALARERKEARPRLRAWMKRETLCPLSTLQIEAASDIKVVGSRQTAFGARSIRHEWRRLGAFRPTAFSADSCWSGFGMMTALATAGRR